MKMLMIYIGTNYICITILLTMGKPVLKHPLQSVSASTKAIVIFSSSMQSLHACSAIYDVLFTFATIIISNLLIPSVIFYISLENIELYNKEKEVPRHVFRWKCKRAYCDKLPTSMCNDCY